MSALPISGLNTTKEEIPLAIATSNRPAKSELPLLDLNNQSYWLDDSMLDLLQKTFDEMDELVPNVGEREHLKGKITREKGIRWSSIMGCNDAQLKESCPADGMSADKIWKVLRYGCFDDALTAPRCQNRILRFSFYSETCRGKAVVGSDPDAFRLGPGEWFDFEGASINIIPMHLVALFSLEAIPRADGQRRQAFV